MGRYLLYAAVGGFVLFLLISFCLPTFYWIGGVPRTVDLKVVDATTSAPLAGARVHQFARDVGVTDTKGELTWPTVFNAGGESGSIFGQSGHWSVSGELTITATDGRTVVVDLAQLTGGERRPLSDDDRVSVTVTMPASTTTSPDSAFQTPATSPQKPTVRASASALYMEKGNMLGGPPIQFVLVGLWRFDAENDQWHAIEFAPSVAVIQPIAVGDGGVQTLAELPKRVGLYCVKWKENDVSFMSLAFNGPIMCNDVMIGDAPEGKVATCVPFEDHAELAL